MPTTVRTPSTAMIELNRAPVASTPMRCSIAAGPCSWMTWAIVKTLEIDWIETSVLHVASGVDLTVGGDEGDPEQVRVDLGERRNIVGVLAFLERPELCVCGVNRLLDLGWRLCACRYRHGERPQTEQARPDRETPNTFYPPFLSPPNVVVLHFTCAASQARTLRRPSSKIRW